MKYKITIETLTPVQDSKYPDKEEIFTEIVEDIDLLKIIDVVNQKNPKN